MAAVLDNPSMTNRSVLREMWELVGGLCVVATELDEQTAELRRISDRAAAMHTSLTNTNTAMRGRKRASG